MMLLFYNEEAKNYFAAVNKEPWIYHVAFVDHKFLELFKNDILIVNLPNLNKIRQYRKLLSPIFINQPQLQLGEVFTQHFPELLL